jgi:hypothetical protein
VPYVPDEAMKALKYFYRDRGSELYGLYGPYDAFNDNLNWIKKAYIGIDQGPIMVMTENYRSGLLWNNVMKDPDVRAGLNKLGFQYVTPDGVMDPSRSEETVVYPNPCQDKIYIRFGSPQKPQCLKVISIDGRSVLTRPVTENSSPVLLDCSGLKNGCYFVTLIGVKQANVYKIFIQK